MQLEWECECLVLVDSLSLSSPSHPPLPPSLPLSPLSPPPPPSCSYGDHATDLNAALSSRTKGTPTIVLAHQPRAAMEAIQWSDVRLTLSGHTHGGQFFPYSVFVYFLNPLFVGLYEPSPGVFVYVSPGTLYYVIPFRHYRPEITYFTLQSV